MELTGHEKANRSTTNLKFRQDQELVHPDEAEPLTTPEIKQSTSAADLNLITSN